MNDRIIFVHIVWLQCKDWTHLGAIEKHIPQTPPTKITRLTFPLPTLSCLLSFPSPFKSQEGLSLSLSLSLSLFLSIYLFLSFSLSVSLFLFFSLSLSEPQESVTPLWTVWIRNQFWTMTPRSLWPFAWLCKAR